MHIKLNISMLFESVTGKEVMLIESCLGFANEYICPTN